MRLASMKGSRDGELIVVSRDMKRYASTRPYAQTLLEAIERWDEIAPHLASIAAALEKPGDWALTFDPLWCAAPLPRAPQWCDASAFLNHGRLMEQAYKVEPIPDFDTIPVMYQGASDDFLGPHADVALPAEEDGIDFEGEFGVIVGDVRMGASAEECLKAVRLIVQINDWSLRALGPREMRTGFGFLQAKPSTSFAPVAVTPDELGQAWRNARVNMRLQIDWNGKRFGQPSGSEMNYGFDQLIAHAARTRRLSAGTVIGSGTVSNKDRAAGSACIAERRALEAIDSGAPKTGFMRFGDRVRMQAIHESGEAGPFGVIDQQVVKAPTA